MNTTVREPSSSPTSPSMLSAVSTTLPSRKPLLPDLARTEERELEALGPLALPSSERASSR